MKNIRKTLVVYYSYEGSTRLIAETIADTLKADILTLKPLEEMTSKGFLKFFKDVEEIRFL